MSSVVVLASEELRQVLREEVEALRRELRDALAATHSEQLLSPTEAAAELGVSPRTVQRWLRESPNVIARGRIRRISRANLQILAGRAVDAGP